MSNILVRILLTLILITLLAVIAGCATPKYEMSNLTLSQEQIVAGESATISVDIANGGGGQGKYLVTLKIDNVESDHQEIIIGPGETKQVSFIVSKQEPGTHIIDVNGMTVSLMVLRPAEFVVENITVSPQQVVVGQEASVSVDVKNTGEIKGVCQLVLKTDGIEAESQEVTINPSSTQNVIFTLVADEAGTHSIDINGITSALKVIKLATTPEPETTPPPVTTATPTVAFTRFNYDAWEERIFLIKGDGTGLKQLTLVDNVQEHFPRISPDLMKIAFGRCEKGDTFDIYLMNIDGSGRVNITDSPGKDDMPAWSPDGKYIAFISTRAFSSERYSDIYVMAPDGSNVKRLTFDPAIDWLPVWSPDGSKIAFLSNRDGKWKWWLMNSDGSNLRLLADIEVYDETISVPIVLLQATWSRFFLEGTFFTPLITKEEQCVISIDVTKGERWALDFADALNMVEAPNADVILTYFSNNTNSYDLAIWPADTPSRILISGPEQDIAGSCTILMEPEASISHPIIDGTITAGEWDTAFKTNFNVGTANGPVSGTIYTVHDNENIYMAVRFAYGTISSGDSLSVNFDNDGTGGARVIGDDVIQFSTSFTDMFITEVGSTPEIGASYKADTMAGGQNDGDAKRSTDGTYTTYELWHPLDSSDNLHDFSLQPGSEFGFTITLKVGSIFTSFPTGWMIKTDEYIRVLIVP